MLQTPLAFLRKDLLEATSYRLNFVLGAGGIVLTLLFLALVSDFVGPLVEQRLDGYQGNYFSFVVLGIGLQSFLSTALLQLSSDIRRAQTLGTLEALLATRTSVAALMACMPLYAFLQTSTRVFGYLVLGVWFFDMPIRWGNWPAALAVLALTIVAFACLGMVVASFTIAFKRSQPITTLISALSLFLGGIYYPLSVLPNWIRDYAYLLPITPALEGIRLALLNEGSWRDIAPFLLMLTAFIVILTPVALLAFRWALRRSMRDGTLTQY